MNRWIFRTLFASLAFVLLGRGVLVAQHPQRILAPAVASDTTRPDTLKRAVGPQARPHGARVPKRVSTRAGTRRAKPQPRPGTGLQATTQCVEGCGGGGGEPPVIAVSVDPDQSSLGAIAMNATGRTQLFTVTNIGDVSDSYALTCSAANATCGQIVNVLTGLPVTELTIPAHSERDLQVTYSTGSGVSGSLGLTATSMGYWPPPTDSGNVTWTFIGGEPKAGVTFVNQNGDNLDHGKCLSTDAGEEASVTCGDLVVTHSTLTYATLERERKVTLLYNSGTSTPRPIVAANVTLNPALVPTTLTAELRINGVLRGWSDYYGNWTSAPYTRQVSLHYDAAADTTGIYPFTFTVRATYPSTTKDSVVSGELLVVNRTASPYGRGWGLVGVEQLVFSSANRILLVGGDASAAVYTPVSPGVWVAPLGDFRDTLKLDTSVSPNRYVRTLRHGAQVRYDLGGRHTETVSRLGQSTSIYWNAAGTRVDSLMVPPAGQSVKYRFYYDGSGKLDYVTEPGGRTMQATVTAGDLVAFIDPDTLGPVYAYDGIGHMSSRTDAQGVATTYIYANSNHLTHIYVPIGRDSADAELSLVLLNHWSEWSLNVVPGTQAAIDTAYAYTKIVRAGYVSGLMVEARFWLDRFGAPSTIRDPAGAYTKYTHGDAAFPALVTRVDYPDPVTGAATGRYVRQTYNARGNLVSVADTSSHMGAAALPAAISRWTYADPDAIDAPDSIIDPVGRVTRIDYAATGLPSTVTAWNGHQTTFTYLTAPLAGLVAGTTEVNVPSWDSVSQTEVTSNLTAVVAYNALGNMVGDTTPSGYARTLVRDAQQRVTDLYDVANYRTQFAYNAIDQVTTSTFHAETAGLTGFAADSGVVAPMVTTNVYAKRRLIRVLDPRSVKREYGFDLAGRTITETDQNNQVIRTYYNAFGLVDSVRQRTGHFVRFTYDSAGRLKIKSWPARDVSQAGSITYTYDRLGRATTIVSAPYSGLVDRTYYANGLLRSERQRGADSINYNYDAAGRRTYMSVGNRNAANTHDDYYYRYDPTSGDLRWVVADWRTFNVNPVDRDSVEILYDALGRRDWLTYDNGTTVQFAYDREGTLRLVCGNHPGDPAAGGADALDYTYLNGWVDRRGDSRYSTTGNYIPGRPAVAGCAANGMPTNETWTSYDARGQMLQQRRTGAGGMDNLEKYRYDASGNRTLFRKQYGVVGTTWHQDLYTYAANSNRLLSTARTRGGSIDYTFEPLQANSFTFTYDLNGSRATERTTCRMNGQYKACVGSGTWNVGYRDYLYDGTGQVAATTEYAPNGSSWQLVTPTTPNCHYDAVGRLWGPCQNASPNLTFDGNNVVRTLGAANTSGGMSFLTGPGSDDPMMGAIPNGSQGQRYIWITNGSGRQFVVAQQDGLPITSSSQAGQQFDAQGGAFAGGSANSFSFANERQPVAAMQAMSFYRNRFYDQRSGAWTQEDPMGVAGGMNLYQFSGNNPSSLSDPYGLSPWRAIRRALRTGWRAVGHGFRDAGRGFRTAARALNIASLRVYAALAIINTVTHGVVDGAQAPAINPPANTQEMKEDWEPVAPGEVEESPAQPRPQEAEGPGMGGPTGGGGVVTGISIGIDEAVLLAVAIVTYYLTTNDDKPLPAPPEPGGGGLIPSPTPGHITPPKAPPVGDPAPTWDPRHGGGGPTIDPYFR